MQSHPTTIGSHTVNVELFGSNESFRLSLPSLMPSPLSSSSGYKRKSPDDNASSHGRNRAKVRKVEQLVNGFFIQHPPVEMERGSDLCKLPYDLGSYLYTYFALHANDPIPKDQTEQAERNSASDDLLDSRHANCGNFKTHKPMERTYRPQRLKLTMVQRKGPQELEGSSANVSVVDPVFSPSREQDTLGASEIESLPDDLPRQPKRSMAQPGQPFEVPGSAPLITKSSDPSDSIALKTNHANPLEARVSASTIRDRPYDFPRSWDETHPAGT